MAVTFPPLVGTTWRQHARPPTAADRSDRAYRARVRRQQRSARQSVVQQLRDWPTFFVLGLLGLAFVLLMTVPVMHGL